MEILKSIKVEALCVLFGFFGFIIALEGENVSAGLGLSGSAVTSYFAFKKDGDGEKIYYQRDPQRHLPPPLPPPPLPRKKSANEYKRWFEK